MSRVILIGDLAPARWSEGEYSEPEPWFGEEQYATEGTIDESEAAYNAWLESIAGYEPEAEPEPEPEPEPAPATGGGWPAAVGARRDAWIVRDDGSVRYRLAEGDTLAGIATTYLGAPQRWSEIHDLNGRLTGREPDGYYAGELLVMPDDAIRDAQRRGFLPGGAGGVGEPPGLSTGAKVAIGVGATVAVAAIGAGVWYVAT